MKYAVALDKDQLTKGNLMMMMMNDDDDDDGDVDDDDDDNDDNDDEWGWSRRYWVQMGDRMWRLLIWYRYHKLLK